VCEHPDELPPPGEPAATPAATGLRLGDRARAAMRCRHFSPRTEATYLGWMRRCHEFHGRRDPARLGAEHVSAFLDMLAVHGRVAAATQNQALAARSRASTSAASRRRAARQGRQGPRDHAAAVDPVGAGGPRRARAVRQALASLRQAVHDVA